ncbi:T3SS (YopN, CesT) and YbjN peptide-binding chaperone 1 [Nocardioides oleivorans]|uniref:T3SS (YopN, CesT) and YbjN peptide-binding chaperone 1 n=1 Tax=Nocardioides oleivorans TaxID=273676 RepID=UPI0013EAF2FE|nr:hypothetical protein [Nocardioides oleivorans]
MSDELERRWDDAVDTAWRGFRQRLADRLAELADGDGLALDTGPEHEAVTTCEVTLADGVLWVQVVSDGRSEVCLQLEPREVDRAAVVVVRALREVYGVLHPVYLEAEGLEPERTGFKPLPPKPLRAQRPDLDAVVRATSADDVRAVIDLAVAEIYGETLEWDDDGDLGLPTDESCVWVLVNKHAPHALLTCLLVDGVEDESAALAEVNRLNGTELGLSFVLVGGRISVTRELGLAAAVPSAVGIELQRLLTQVDGWAQELSEALRAASEPSGEPKGSRFATAYAVMAELEREERGSVGAIAMLRIYDNDPGLMLKAIRITEQRRREARAKVRAARAEGRRTKEKVQQARHDYLRDLASRMRGALRLLVDGPVRKPQLDQLALFDEDEAGTGR